MSNDSYTQELPPDLRWKLDNESVWTDEVPEWATVKPKSVKTVNLAQYMAPGGARRYTCPICFYRYDESKVKWWWKKPDRVKKELGIPACPYCGICGGIHGWHKDLNGWEPDEPLNIKPYVGGTKKSGGNYGKRN